MSDVLSFLFICTPLAIIWVGISELAKLLVETNQ